MGNDSVNYIPAKSSSQTEKTARPGGFSVKLNVLQADHFYTMQKIVPNLWFDGNAREAVDYYVSVFPNSKIISTTNYPSSAEEGLADFQINMAGKLLTAEFDLNGQHFTAINAGPEFKFTEAVSFAVYCKDQAEIDYYWEKLSANSANEQCGWCKDKFGLSWQVIPENMEELMKKPNAFSIMMGQKKIVISDF